MMTLPVSVATSSAVRSLCSCQCTCTRRKFRPARVAGGAAAGEHGGTTDGVHEACAGAHPSVYCAKP
eukprot:353652-Chlamydomonas_euryale.AAC.4